MGYPICFVIKFNVYEKTTNYNHPDAYYNLHQRSRF